MNPHDAEDANIDAAALTEPYTCNHSTGARFRTPGHCGQDVDQVQLGAFRRAYPSTLYRLKNAQEQVHESRDVRH